MSRERDEVSRVGASPRTHPHVEFDDEKEKKKEESPLNASSSTTDLPTGGSWNLTDLFFNRIWLVYFIVLTLAMAYRFWKLEPMTFEPILMRPGSKLYPGQWKASKTHHVILDIDGNLLLYHILHFRKREGHVDDKGKVLWQSRTGNKDRKRCRWCYAKLRKCSKRENPCVTVLEVRNGRKLLADFPLATFPLELHILET